MGAARMGFAVLYPSYVLVVGLGWGSKVDGVGGEDDGEPPIRPGTADGVSDLGPQCVDLGHR